MQKRLSSKIWLIGSHVSIRKSVILAAIAYLVLSVAYLNGGKELVYHRIVNPLEFKLRNQSGHFTPLHPSIKIFAVDQKTMNEIQSEQIAVQDWTYLFQALAKARPKAIFIDKMFSLPLSQDPKVIANFQKAIRAAAPVTAGATVAASPLPSLTELKLSISANEPLSFIKLSPGYLYGPNPAVAEVFSHIGHTNDDGDGYIKPFYRFSEGRGIPHWGLANNELTVQNNALVVNNATVHLDEDGKALVNLASPESYWKRTYSLVNLLKSARLGAELHEITSDNIVVILTAMYQGTIAYKTTPAGLMPGGFIMVEVINSALNGTWLKTFPWELGYLALGCILGTLLGWGLSVIWFWPALIFVEVVVTAIGFLAFKHYGYLLPWAFPAIGIFISSIILFAEKSRLMAANSKTVQLSLEGLVGPSKLKQILSLQSTFSLDPQNQVLTILFIDIVGFSVAAERESPTIVFGHLRSLLSTISDIVHDCGGITDRSLGDGLLCFFGYQYGSETDKDHAVQALNCAIRIQKEILSRDLAALKSGPFIFPVRIGINTGEVYIGDLGGKSRIDFTIIGSSVNFAQRLEASCQNYSIMCGAATRDALVPDSALASRLLKKFIPVKNIANLVEAYELDPFSEDPALQASRQVLNRAQSKSERVHERWPVKPGLFVRLNDNSSVGNLVNFSQPGVGIHFQKYIGKGAVISFTVYSEDGKFEEFLKENGFNNFVGVVRWSWPEDSGYRTGIELQNLTPEMQSNLVNCFRKF